MLESVHLMLCWPSGEKITLRKAGLGMGWLEFKLLPGRQRPSSSGGKFSRQGSFFQMNLENRYLDRWKSKKGLVEWGWMRDCPTLRA